MTLKAWLTSPFTQPQVQGTTVSPVSDHPVMIALPVAPGASDATMIAEHRLRVNHGDGAALSDALRLMIARAPKVAEAVIHAATLGRESERQAAISLRVFQATRVATVPDLSHL